MSRLWNSLSEILYRLWAVSVPLTFTGHFHKGQLHMWTRCWRKSQHVWPCYLRVTALSLPVTGTVVFFNINGRFWGWEEEKKIWGNVEQRKLYKYVQYHLPHLLPDFLNNSPAAHNLQMEGYQTEEGGTETADNEIQIFVLEEQDKVLSKSTNKLTQPDADHGSENPF